MFSAHHALSHNFAQRVLHFAQHRASFFQVATRIYHNFDRFFLPLSSLMWISKRIFICYLQYTYILTYLTHVEKKLWSFGYNANKQQQQQKNRKLFFYIFYFRTVYGAPLNFLSTFSKRELLCVFHNICFIYNRMRSIFISATRAHLQKSRGKCIYAPVRARYKKKTLALINSRLLILRANI